MIQLTRLNGSLLAINSDLIKFVEAAPDTVLTLVTGEKVIVRESPGEVIERVREFRRSVLCGAHTAMRLAADNEVRPADQGSVSVQSEG